MGAANVRAMSDPSPRGIERANVDAWITANVADAVAPYSYELIAAGGSNLTFRVTDSGGRQWALRRPPVGHALPTAHDMSREWRIMAALTETFRSRTAWPTAPTPMSTGPPST